MTIIEQIKAEIERLIVKHELEYTTAGYVMNELLSFLSTLESEKPMNQNGLEREIERCLWKLSDDPSNEELRMFARHFAELGAEHAREKMMAEAVEGEVCIPNVWVEHKEGKELVVRAEISKELGFKFGDKVRIIIVKED